MNKEQIQKLKEVALRAPKNPGEWPFYLRSFQAAASPAAILELIALADRTTAPATTPDTSQDWAKLDGAQAFHLIERHADGWEETGNMMESWLAARMGTTPVSLTDEAIEEIWKAIPTKEFQDGEKLELFSYAKAKRLEFARALLAAAPAPIQQEPVLWVESEPSARLLPLDEIINGMCFTVLYHHKKPQTDNPVWPLYAGAALAGSQVQAAGDAVDAARYRWLREKRDIPHGSRNIPWVVALDPEEKIHTMILRAGIDLDHAIDAAMREQP